MKNQKKGENFWKLVREKFFLNEGTQETNVKNEEAEKKFSEKTWCE